MNNFIFFYFFLVSIRVCFIYRIYGFSLLRIIFVTFYCDACITLYYFEYHMILHINILYSFVIIFSRMTCTYIIPEFSFEFFMYYHYV